MSDVGGEGDDVQRSDRVPYWCWMLFGNEVVLMASAGTRRLGGK